MSFDFEKCRYEKKFVASGLDEKEIEHIIKLNPAMFSEIFWKRQINNIYFDTEGMGNYWKHLNGISNRLKIRIRWYEKTFSLVNGFLEVKIRNNDLGNKKRFPLKSFILDRNFSLKSLMDVFEKSKLPPGLLEELRISKPVLLNSYK